MEAPALAGRKCAMVIWIAMTTQMRVTRIVVVSVRLINCWVSIHAWLPQVRKWSGEKILQDQGKVTKSYFESGKIDILKESLGKLKL